jgi:hypothetical protein
MPSKIAFALSISKQRLTSRRSRLLAYPTYVHVRSKGFQETEILCKSRKESRNTIRLLPLDIAPAWPQPAAQRSRLWCLSTIHAHHDPRQGGIELFAEPTPIHSFYKVIYRWAGSYAHRLSSVSRARNLEYTRVT